MRKRDLGNIKILSFILYVVIDAMDVLDTWLFLRKAFICPRVALLINLLLSQVFAHEC